MTMLDYVSESRNIIAVQLNLTSKTKIPAPSPITKPSLSLSKGLEADAGQSLYFVDKARALYIQFNC